MGFFSLGFVGGPSRSDEDFGGSDGGDSVENLGGAGGGDGEIFSSKSSRFCSCSHPFWAVNLNFGSFFPTRCHDMLPISPWMLRAFNVSGSKVLFHHVFPDLVFLSAVNGGSKRNLTVPQLPKHIPKTVHIGLAVVDSTLEDFRG